MFSMTEAHLFFYSFFAFRFSISVLAGFFFCVFFVT